MNRSKSVSLHRFPSGIILLSRSSARQAFAAAQRPPRPPHQAPAPTASPPAIQPPPSPTARSMPYSICPTQKPATIAVRASTGQASSAASPTRATPISASGFPTTIRCCTTPSPAPSKNSVPPTATARSNTTKPNPAIPSSRSASACCAKLTTRPSISPRPIQLDRWRQVGRPHQPRRRQLQTDAQVLHRHRIRVHQDSRARQERACPRSQSHTEKHRKRNHRHPGLRARLLHD